MPLARPPAQYDSRDQAQARSDIDQALSGLQFGKAEKNRQQAFGAGQAVTPVALGSVSGLVTLDLALSNSFELTATGDVFLANPANAIAGVTFDVTVKQDAVGGHAITFDTAFAVPVGAGLTSSPGARDIVSGKTASDGVIDVRIANAIIGLANQLRYGARDPVGSDGIDGDFWRNTVAQTEFGPKANGVWPAGISIRGPRGYAGASFTAGQGPPSAASASGSGNTYLDEVAGTYYLDDPGGGGWLQQGNPGAAKGPTGVQPWTTPPVAWAAGTTYAAAAPASSVTYGGESYVCSVAHTSGASFDGSKFVKIAAKGATGTGGGAVTRGAIAGLGLANGSGAQILNVALGQACDSTGSSMIALGAATTKKLAAGWAAGGGSNGLDTGSPAANTCYHVHLIAKADASATDILFSASATAPTLPSGYTLFRRIGAMWTDSSVNWIVFTQILERFYLGALLAVAVGASTSTSATLLTLYASNKGGAPTGVRVKPLLLASGTGSGTLLTDPAEPDTTPNTAFASGPFSFNGSTVAAAPDLYTNVSAQIRVRSAASGGSLTVYLRGWDDPRGRFD